MGIMYVFGVAALFGLVGIIWGLYEGRKLDNQVD